MIMKLTKKEQELKDRLKKDFFNRNNVDDEYNAFVRLLKAFLEDKDIEDKKAIQISNILMEIGPNVLSVYEWKYFYEYGVGKRFFIGEPCANTRTDANPHDIQWEDMYEAYINEDELCVSCRKIIESSDTD